MTHWGREAAPGAAIIAQSRLGRRSVILAIVALVVACAATTWFVSLPKDAGGTVQNLALGVFIAVFFIAAPLMHIAGIVCGVMALGRSSDSRSLGLLGLLLNLIFLGTGIVLVWAATSTIGAFT